MSNNLLYLIASAVFLHNYCSDDIDINMKSYVGLHIYIYIYVYLILKTLCEINNDEHRLKPTHMC